MGKMKVFLDTNVVVDFCAERKPFYEKAAAIFEMAHQKKTTLVVSSLTIVNMAYVIRKVMPRELVMRKIKKLIQSCQIASIDKETVLSAVTSCAMDFEDAVQHFSALQAGADLIITRDPNGFKDFRLPVMSPSQFIDRCTE